MSGPIRFMILAIVISTKNLRYVCFVRTLCVVQSIHTELADLYSQKVVSAWFWPADFDPLGLSLQREWSKDGAAPVVLDKWKDA
jgi:hypothetical protein